MIIKNVLSQVERWIYKNLTETRFNDKKYIFNVFCYKFPLTVFKIRKGLFSVVKSEDINFLKTDFVISPNFKGTLLSD